MTRHFSLKTATREAVPLIIGLAGPSGSGKTYSALRLATGMAEVFGGSIAVIDTEARRALHYAERFHFEHMAFGAPFDPDSYLAAVQHCIGSGASIIVIDSMSHEHEGPGGVIEMHAAEVKRRAGDDFAKQKRVQMAAWIEPKRARNRLLQGMIHSGANLILCFRAKEKIKPRPGKDPENLGWMPIAGDEFAYECTLFASLNPGANGVPTWRPTEKGEKGLIKQPEQFRHLFGDPQKPAQLDEAMGRAMAEWAFGDRAAKAMLAIGGCRNLEQIDAWMADNKATIQAWSEPERRRVREQVRRRRKTLLDLERPRSGLNEATGEDS